MAISQWGGHFFIVQWHMRDLNGWVSQALDLIKQYCLRQKMDIHLLPHWRDSITDAEQVPSSAPNTEQASVFFLIKCLCAFSTTLRVWTHMSYGWRSPCVSKLTRLTITFTSFAYHKHITHKRLSFDVWLRSGHSHLPRCKAPQLVVLQSKADVRRQVPSSAPKRLWKMIRFP